MEKKQNIQIANNLNNALNLLDTIIRKMAQEQYIFIKEDPYIGYFISLNTNFKNLINQNNEVIKSLEQSVRLYISQEIYPLYKDIIGSKEIFKMINTSSVDSTISMICLFMNNIQVFSIYGKDLSYLNAHTQEAFLNLPKGIFHPEYQNKT